MANPAIEIKNEDCVSNNLGNWIPELQTRPQQFERVKEKVRHLIDECYSFKNDHLDSSVNKYFDDKVNEVGEQFIWIHEPGYD